MLRWDSNLGLRLATPSRWWLGHRLPSCDLWLIKWCNLRAFKQHQRQSCAAYSFSSDLLQMGQGWVLVLPLFLRDSNLLHVTYGWLNLIQPQRLQAVLDSLEPRTASLLTFYKCVRVSSLYHLLESHACSRNCAELSLKWFPVSVYKGECRASRNKITNEAASETKKNIELLKIFEWFLIQRSVEWVRTTWLTAERFRNQENYTSWRFSCEFV